QTGLASWPCFGPNGRFLAYVRKNGSNWELRRFSFSSATDLVLVGPVGAEIKSPRWTNDAQAIYFTKNDTLYAVSSSGGTVYNKMGLLAGKLATEFDLHRGEGRLLLEQPGTFPFHRVCLNPMPDSTIPFRRVGLCDTLAAGDTQARFYQTG